MRFFFHQYGRLIIAAMIGVGVLKMSLGDDSYLTFVSDMENEKIEIAKEEDVEVEIPIENKKIIILSDGSNIIAGRNVEITDMVRAITDKGESIEVTIKDVRDARNNIVEHTESSVVFPLAGVYDIELKVLDDEYNMKIPVQEEV